MPGPILLFFSQTEIGKQPGLRGKTHHPSGKIKETEGVTILLQFNDIRETSFWNYDIIILPGGQP
jgi:hypothetical protein